MWNHATRAYKERRFKDRPLVPCAYCGRRLRIEEATVDHKIPKSNGGSNYYENLVIACSDCNMSKADGSVEEHNATSPWEKAAKLLRGIR